MEKLCSIQYTIKYSDSPYTAAVKEYKPHVYAALKIHKQPQIWSYACKTQIIQFNTTALQVGGASPLTYTKVPLYFMAWELSRRGFRKASCFDQHLPNSNITYGWVCVVAYLGCFSWKHCDKATESILGFQTNQNLWNTFLFLYFSNTISNIFWQTWASIWKTIGNP